MNFDHEPVLAREVVELFRSVAPRTLVDGTLGGGGHAFALLEALPTLRLIGIDRDANARAAAAARLAGFGERVSVHESTFARTPEVVAELGESGVDGLLVDLGVSSHQLDAGERGFSFRADAPLDMRMDQSKGQTAAELIAEVDVHALADILWRYGEERQSRRLARAIKSELPTRTGELAGLIERLMPASRGRIHPATRTFQALRIAVNDELGELERWLEAVPSLLNPGGVAAVITFHSLEDRMVKHAFRALTEAPSRSKYLPEDSVSLDFEKVFRRAVVADDDEVLHNPRSRSAKLRAIRRKGGAP
ncbi:MAG: 16S rRNA (cytosine(1402)-N(4))-methyltransferase RsmH [Myxococcota bacterium]